MVLLDTNYLIIVKYVLEIIKKFTLGEVYNIRKVKILLCFVFYIYAEYKVCLELWKLISSQRHKDGSLENIT